MATNPALARLDALEGEWWVAPKVGGQAIGRSRTTFAWAHGGAFLVQHAEAGPTEGVPDEWRANSPLPLTTIIGLDDTTDSFTMLYADARAVFRVYQMSLDGGVWRIWRDAPGFCQRFTGTFSDDGGRIEAYWELSRDGSTWDKDFDLTYTRV